MTPDQARRLLDGTTPGPWRLQAVKGHPHLRHITTGTGHSGDPTAAVCIPVDVTSREGAANMAAKASVPSMLETIAGMHEEWGVHVTGYPKNIADWAEICDTPADSTEWFATEEAAEEFATEREDDGFDTRIVRRYVTTPEEA